MEAHRLRCNLDITSILPKEEQMNASTTSKINEQIKVLEDVKSKKITQKEAAQRLDCTTRNIRLKLKKYALKGRESLIHGNKGRVSL